MNKVIALALVLQISLFAESSKLIRIKDGDTVLFKTGTCRLAYIDTPESRRNKKAKKDIKKCTGVNLDDVINGGRYAKKYLKSIMKKGTVYEYDVLGTDRYGRFICVIYDGSGEAINAKMVYNGFAIPFWKYIKKDAVKSKMVEYLQYARSNNKGIWRLSPDLLVCMNGEMKHFKSKKGNNIDK